jgi:fatty-acyl-CoA synthase
VTDAGLGSLLRRCASDHAARTAVWCEGREQTYAELLGRASRVANALGALGVRRGERVAMLGPNAS